MRMLNEDCPTGNSAVPSVALLAGPFRYYVVALLVAILTILFLVGFGFWYRAELKASREDS